MRRFALFAILAIPAVAARGQATGSIIAGVVSSNTPESESGTTVSLGTRTGLAVGLELESPLQNRRIEFTPGLLYVQKGSTDQESGGTLQIRLSYIEVPVLFRLFLSDAKARPFILAGAHVAIKTSCSLSFDGNDGASTKSSCADVSVESDTKGVDYGITLGGGVQLRHIALSARYDLGLSNIPKQPEPGLTVNNRAWLFLASFAVR